MGHQPIMVDVVKAAFDIRFQSPLGRNLAGHANEYLAHGVRRGAISPKAVAVRIARGLGHRLKAKQVECLHGPVEHGGDVQSQLHCCPTILWAMPRFDIRFIRSKVNVLQY
jgi:hypothetical protein